MARPPWNSFVPGTQADSNARSAQVYPDAAEFTRKWPPPPGALLPRSFAALLQVAAGGLRGASEAR